MMPPPLPSRKHRRTKRILVTLVGVASALGFCVVAIAVLQLFGFIRAFSIPSAGMAPTINRGDQFFVERLTYVMGKPRRGDIVVFQTDGVRTLPPHELYVKRLIGLPGDVLTISKGVLCVNGQPALFNSKPVAMPKLAPLGVRYLADDWDTVKVPDGQYFVMGDNVANSVDSRYFGCLPTNAVVYRTVFRYFPINRMGWVH